LSDLCGAHLWDHHLLTHLLGPPCRTSLWETPLMSTIWELLGDRFWWAPFRDPPWYPLGSPTWLTPLGYSHVGPSLVDSRRGTRLGIPPLWNPLEHPPGEPTSGTPLGAPPCVVNPHLEVPFVATSWLTLLGRPHLEDPHSETHIGCPVFGPTLGTTLCTLVCYPHLRTPLCYPLSDQPFLSPLGLSALAAPLVGPACGTAL
jgi:hypothetical protein